MLQCVMSIKDMVCQVPIPDYVPKDRTALMLVFFKGYSSVILCIFETPLNQTLDIQPL